MWNTVNNEGYRKDTLHSIVNIRFESNAVKDGFYYDKNGSRKLMKTTIGCKLLIAI